MNRTLERSVEILETISNAREGITLNEIVERFDLPKTSAFDIIQSLQELGMLEVVPGNPKRYVIGLRAFTIGKKYTQNLEILDVAKEVVENVVKQLNMTVFLAKIDGNKVVYIYKREPAGTYVATAEISTRNDVYCTSLGKAIVAFTTEDKRQKILKNLTFSPKTNKTITDMDAFEIDLERTRNRGYSIDEQEIDENIMCVGAPIFDAYGNVEYSISAVGIFNPNRDTAMEGQIVKEAGKQISLKLGYSK